ncbi:MAG: prolyl oligopeptidase family serine peptidase [Lachnospiraceae bacterium]|nr:prolyl oligopeptidase family serine peptidase [Lachnospiraceae bacterium]
MDLLHAYQAAEKLLPWNAGHSVLNGEPNITWLDDTHFYYGKESRDGDKIRTEFVLTDCETGACTPLFDHAAVAAALGKEMIPFTACQFQDGILSFTDEDTRYEYDTAAGTLTAKGWAHPKPVVCSPDKKQEVFVKEYDLYLRDTATGKETRLTFTGQKDFAWADSAQYGGVVGMKLAGNERTPNVLWSPDSTHFLTYQLDQRNVKELYVIQSYDDPNVESIRPRLHTYKCAFPEDAYVPMAYYYLYDLESGTMKPLELKPQMTGGGLLNAHYSYAKWLPDSSAFYITYIARGHKAAGLSLVTRDGDTHEILLEENEFLNYNTYGRQDGFGDYCFSNFVTDDGAYALWQSERDDLARLFRYDAKTGALLNAVTPADCMAGKIIAKDDVNEWVYFIGSNLSDTSEPYYERLCRAHYDGSDFSVLTPEDGMHTCTVHGNYVTDTWSRVDLPPVTVLRRTDGTFVRDIVQSDVRDLMERGYIMPERFTVTASDGVTKLYGILIRPADFDPNKTYPMIDYIYGGMQCYNVPKAFTWKAGIAGREMFGGLEEFSQLGFVGIILDGLGTPGRGRKLHSISYENIHGCAGLADHVYVLPQLKEQFPFLDLDRVGMWGNSGGGCATSRAMLEYPDVYKVGVSSAGNHDQRMYNTTWTENYYGLYNKEIYEKGDNTALAANLKGHLFIVHGAMDDNVTMPQSIRLIDALIREDKDFDFLVLPRTDHNVPANPYFIRKKLDYFVRYLLEEEPPKDYRFQQAEK